MTIVTQARPDKPSFSHQCLKHCLARPLTRKRSRPSEQAALQLPTLRLDWAPIKCQKEYVAVDTRSFIHLYAGTRHSSCSAPRTVLSGLCTPS